MNSCGCFVMSLFVGLYTHRGSGEGREKKRKHKSRTWRSRARTDCAVACDGGGALMPCARVVFADVHFFFFLLLFFLSPLVSNGIYMTSYWSRLPGPSSSSIYTGVKMAAQ